MRLRGKQLDAINAALKSGTAEDFNAALQKTCAQAEGIGQFVAAPGSTAPDKRACPCCGILSVTPTKWDGWMCENSFCDVRSFRSRTQDAAPVQENAKLTGDGENQQR